MTRIFIITFYSASAMALACIPLILIVENNGNSQKTYHYLQFIACLIIFISGIASLVIGWHRLSAINKVVVMTGLALVSTWLSFVVYVLVTFDLSGID